MPDRPAPSAATETGSTTTPWKERARAVIPGGTSTGSKRPDALYGPGADGPTHYTRASGCRLTTVDGTELVDCTMALGAVALGYADPEVTEAVIAAAREGHVAGLPHQAEVLVAEQLCGLVPYAEAVRFFKTGAEAAAAAVRIARTHTGRSHVLGCGYFGWLDWSSEAGGVPAGTRQAFSRIPFSDTAAADEAVARAGDDLAAIVIEPVIEREASGEWLKALRALCDRTGALLIADEIKTGFRVHPAGALAARGIRPDLAVFGKAMANGYPLAAVIGGRDVMQTVERTWISSTLAGERTALAAAGVVLARHARENVCERLASVGEGMRERVQRAILATGSTGVALDGIAPMWFLRFDDARREVQVLRDARLHGVLLKRGAYDFPALAHDDAALEAIELALMAALRDQGEAGA